MRSAHGYTKLKKNHPDEAYLGGIFLFGGTQRGYKSDWGYYFDLGVRKYQKVENPCSRSQLLTFDNSYIINVTCKHPLKWKLPD